MSNGLEKPCFGLIAAAELRAIRREAAAAVFCEPFMRDMPFRSPGIIDTVTQEQVDLVLRAEGQRLFALFAPYEDAIRIAAQIIPGTRRLAGWRR